jgi:uncharacterized protein (DUF1778 family)
VLAAIGPERQQPILNFVMTMSDKAPIFCRQRTIHMRMNRTEKIDLRLTAQAKRALLSAAEATHKTLSDFVLESALARADSVLAERQVFRLDAERWTAFLAALDAPPKARPHLARLLNEPSIVD